jgi:hypothetical protein
MIADTDMLHQMVTMMIDSIALSPFASHGRANCSRPRISRKPLIMPFGAKTPMNTMARADAESSTGVNMRARTNRWPRGFRFR